MKIELVIDEKEIFDKVRSMALTLARDRTESLIRSYFATPNAAFKNQPGEGYSIIEAKVIEALTADNLQEKINGLVQFHLKEAIDAAVKTAVDHHVKKAAFTTVKALPKT